MTLRLDGVSLVRLMASSRPAFVLASTTGCTQCDGALGAAWEQLATLTRDQLQVPGAVWRLECDEQPMLCDVLPAVAAATPGDPLFLEWAQGDMIWRRYSGQFNTQGLVVWVRDTLRRAAHDDPSSRGTRISPRTCPALLAGIGICFPSRSGRGSNEHRADWSRWGSTGWSRWGSTAL